MNNSHNSFILFIAAASLVSPAGMELRSFELSTPHTHIETHTVASDSSLTYTISATTAGTNVLNMIRAT
jgi:hypothetical protein